MIPEPQNDRKKANIRYYCDNDRRRTAFGHKTRWKLHDDPDLAPIYYMPQALRDYQAVWGDRGAYPEFYPLSRFPQVPDWYDDVNKM